MNLDERIERLQSHYLANRIIRNYWNEGERTSDGYERACLLAAFSPEAEEAEESSACPADAMPPWLAYLTVSLDDRVSEEAWPAVIARYVAVLPKLVRLPADRLIRLDFETRACAVREARSHATEPKVLAAIDGVLVLLDRASVGREVSKDKWIAQAAAAEAAAAASAAWATASAAAAKAAASATWATTWAKSSKAAEEAARAGAKAAVNAAEAAEAAAAAAAWAAEEAEGYREASWDRMADAMLSAWETAVAL